MTIKARLEALEARRRAGDGPARAFNALEHMGNPHLAQDPRLAGQLRAFKVGYALQACATASAVCSDLRAYGIAYDHAAAQAALEAYQRSAADHFARFRTVTPAAPA